jgi:hypothetical protein
MGIGLVLKHFLQRPHQYLFDIEANLILLAYNFHRPIPLCTSGFVTSLLWLESATFGSILAKFGLDVIGPR